MPSLITSIVTSLLLPILGLSPAVGPGPGAPGAKAAPVPVDRRTGPAVPIGISPSASLIEATPAQAAATMAAIAASGAGWIRVDVPWFSVETRPGVFDWSTTDRIVAAASGDGLKVLPILDYAPAWAMKAGQPDPAAFGAFAAAAAARYPEVTTWEVWNEENEGWAWPSSQVGSLPAVNPAAYGALLKDAYTAIHHAGRSETVILGGMGPAGDNSTTLSPQTFLTDVLRDGYGAYLNAVGMHPYTYPYLPGQVPSTASASDGMTDLFDVHEILASAGLDLPVWVTEFGAPTGGLFGESTSQQAETLALGWNQVAAQKWIGGFFAYSWQDDSSQQYGLHTTAGVAKPAFPVFRQIVAAA